MNKKVGLIAVVFGVFSILFSACSNEPKPSISVESSEEISESIDPSLILINSISLPNTEYSVQVGKSLTLRPTVLPENASIKTLKWTSSNPKVISVNNSGYIKSNELGMATITIAATDGSRVQTSIKVTSVTKAVTKISLNYTSKEANIGESFTLVPSITPSDASFKDVVFKSENANIAKVDDTGLVTCVGEGETNIIASSATNVDVKATCKVKSNKVAVRNFSLRSKSVYLHINDKKELITNFVPSNASNKKVTYTSSNTKVAKVDENGVVTGLSAGYSMITGVSNETGTSDFCNVHVEEGNGVLKTELSYVNKDYYNHIFYGLDCAPTLKETNFLIIPIWFTDSSNYIADNKKQSVLDDINKAFFGENEETGWRSVRTYYEEESFETFTIGGTVTKWFECGAPSSQYRKSSDNNTGLLVSSAIQWVNKIYPDLDLTKYDMDGNGYIDALVFVYGAPDYASLRDWDADNLWAYCTWKGGSSRADINNPIENGYLWASYDFMYNPGQNAFMHTGKSQYGYGQTNLEIDAHTFIHETGHLFGVHDYYDYSQQYSPAGGFSMQDYNIGMHDPYSLMTYGWVQPYIPSKSCTIEIEPFATSGDVILLSPEFNSIGSPFDEYILLEFYSPLGLNKRDLDENYRYINAPKEYGIRVWHVDARLVKGNRFDQLKPSGITNNPIVNTDEKVYFAFSNTYAGGGGNISPLGENYADYNVLQLIRNNINETYKPKNSLKSEDLFKQGDTFSMSKFQNQFVNQTKLNNDEDLNWSFSIETLNEEIATIKLTKKA